MHVLGIVLSIFLGAVTHIVWDIFTHPSIVTETFLPVLSTTLYDGYGQIIKVYRILQHSSTLTGFLILGFYLNRFFRSTRSRNSEPLGWTNTLRNSLRIGLLLIVVCVGVYNGFDAFEQTTPSRQFTYFIRYFIIGGMNAVFICLGLIGLAWLFLKQRYKADSER